jgi:hypothetical protein
MLPGLLVTSCWIPAKRGVRRQIAPGTNTARLGRRNQNRQDLTHLRGNKTPEARITLVQNTRQRSMRDKSVGSRRRTKAQLIDLVVNDLAHISH